MRIIHGKGYTEDDRKPFKVIIKYNEQWNLFNFNKFSVHSVSKCDFCNANNFGSYEGKFARLFLRKCLYDSIVEKKHKI